MSHPKEAANTINAWCANVTNNHIHGIVTPADVQSQTYFILLMNAIHFMGYWSKPFAKSESAIKNFFIDSETSMRVSFMSKTDEYYYLDAPDLDAQILRLPYKVKTFK